MTLRTAPTPDEEGGIRRLLAESRVLVVWSAGRQGAEDCGREDDDRWTDTVYA